MLQLLGGRDKVAEKMTAEQRIKSHLESIVKILKTRSCHMQSILTKLSDEKAAKEVKQFTIAGLVLSLASLLIFWWLAIAGVAFSGRGLLLTWHKANKGKATKYRIMAIIGLLAGIASIVAYNLG